MDYYGTLVPTSSQEFYEEAKQFHTASCGCRYGLTWNWYELYVELREDGMSHEEIIENWRI